MLKGRAANYFAKRDKADPGLAARRGYHAMMLSISNAIAKMRQKSGLTQAQLAKAMQTSQSTIGLWESPGYSGYSVGKLYELSERMGFRMTIDFVPDKQDVVITFTQSASQWSDDPAQASLRVQISREQARRSNLTSLAKE